MTTTRISETAAAEIFASIAGTSFVGLTTITTPDTYGGKRVTPFYRKRTVSTVFCGEAPSYEKIVDKRAKAAYTEAVGERPATTESFRAGTLWRGKGRHVGGALVEHTDSGKLYLFSYFMVNSRPKTQYFHADSVKQAGRKVWHRVAKDSVPLKPEGRNAVTVTVDGVEVEAEIVVRCYALASIRSFRVEGVQYVVDHSEPAYLPARLQTPATAAEIEFEGEDEEQGEEFDIGF